MISRMLFFGVRLLSVLRGHSVFSSPPQRPMTSDFEGFFYPRSYPLHLFSYHNSWGRASIFPFECSVLNKGTTGTIFITSSVWGGPWLGIEPGTSRTRSQHYTTMLSRRPGTSCIGSQHYTTRLSRRPGPPALEASTIPLGYRGGGFQEMLYKKNTIFLRELLSCQEITDKHHFTPFSKHKLLLDTT